MDLKQNVGIVQQSLLSWTTAQHADITSVQVAENAVATSTPTKKESLTIRLKPLLLSFLETQKTEWGYMAVNTKEICRRVNGNVSRDFCHSINVKSCMTAKSYSDKRGCAMVPYAQIPCKIKFMQMRSALFKMEKEGLVKSFKGRALDLKNMGKHKVVSSDLYRFWVALNDDKRTAGCTVNDKP